MRFVWRGVFSAAYALAQIAHRVCDIAESRLSLPIDDQPDTFSAFGDLTPDGRVRVVTATAAHPYMPLILTYRQARIVRDMLSVQMDRAVLFHGGAP